MTKRAERGGGGEAGARLGAHMSIAGGVQRAIERACEVEATALQLFVKSARQWKSRPLGDDEVQRFRELAARHGLERHTLAHASYLINLAASDPRIWQLSVEALRDEVERCSRLGVPYLVVHPGSHLGAGETAGLERVACALDRVLESPRRGRGAAERVEVLLEITAGQGSNLGHRFEQLARVLEMARASARLGVCFDTCHALAAGYDFRDPRGYAETFTALDRQIGLARLKAFHLNDSVGGLGSRRDRHAHIGQGELGVAPFRMLLNDRRFRGLPMVLETPKGEDLAEDRRNLAILRGLIGGRAPAQRRAAR